MLKVVVYIPNAIYEQCKKSNETMEEFIKTVFTDWSNEYLVDNGIVDRAIKQISMIEEKFGT